MADDNDLGSITLGLAGEWIVTASFVLTVPQADDDAGFGDPAHRTLATIDLLSSVGPGDSFVISMEEGTLHRTLTFRHTAAADDEEITFSGAATPGIGSTGSCTIAASYSAVRLGSTAPPPAP